MKRAWTLLTVFPAAAALLAACGAGTLDQGEGSDSDSASAVEQLRVQVEQELPHDVTAFTQGLEFLGDTLYEGTGLNGESRITAGPAGAEPEVRKDLPDELFGEGITVTESRVWQLTWTSGIAIERDPDTLEERRRVSYDGEGWGLCDQGGDRDERLVMSNGSATLTFRDPETFDVTGSVEVTEDGEPLDQLNELECVGGVDGDVYANLWHSDGIVRIDPDSGHVTARIDASGLLTDAEAADADVLNGIAAYPDSDQFLITGKLWPKMFRVTFVPA
ncbi:glutaminyl-peptide cyclotransferase [Saccharomonospora sp. CUA-673]|uniref:glutaminyl-peptide cyclotransferase n=1 Tax=Saccharomonospora sp. CUA-673 TaxID=1904969 RepID=UPI0009662896|nr:glutaminyl-peptide cyclotransferase [Saccharomonospora sp. CUA-673]OLT43870.1 glutaminyl-peptide cyclotransferase [Saccharomonospora sp. CUA-673]